MRARAAPGQPMFSIRSASTTLHIAMRSNNVTERQEAVLVAVSILRIGASLGVTDQVRDDEDSNRENHQAEEHLQSTAKCFALAGC